MKHKKVNESLNKLAEEITKKTECYDELILALERAINYIEYMSENQGYIYELNEKLEYLKGILKKAKEIY